MSFFDVPFHYKEMVAAGYKERDRDRDRDRERGRWGRAERSHSEKGEGGTHPRSCVKLQMGQATSLCLWRESGMTGCFSLVSRFRFDQPSFTASKLQRIDGRMNEMAHTYNETDRDPLPGRNAMRGPIPTCDFLPTH